MTDEELYRELLSILGNHCGEPGLGGQGISEGAIETLKRIIAEREELKRVLIQLKQGERVASDSRSETVSCVTVDAAVEELNRVLPSFDRIVFEPADATFKWARENGKGLRISVERVVDTLACMPDPSFLSTLKTILSAKLERDRYVASLATSHPEAVTETSMIVPDGDYYRAVTYTFVQTPPEHKRRGFPTFVATRTRTGKLYKEASRHPATEGTTPPYYVDPNTFEVVSLTEVSPDEESLLNLHVYDEIEDQRDHSQWVVTTVPDGVTNLDRYRIAGGTTKDGEIHEVTRMEICQYFKRIPHGTAGPKKLPMSPQEYINSNRWR